MSIAITAGPVPHPAKPETPAAKPASPPAHSNAGGKPSASDTVSLSPQAQALATLRPAAAPEGAKSKAEIEAEERFFEAVKSFFGDRLGINGQKIAGRPKLNKEALHYILRNTVMGALAPPSLVKELGMDLSKPPPRNGPLAEVTLEAKDRGPALARVSFDPAALEEFARLPKKRKDGDGDGFFTVLDLMPSARKLEIGKPIDNGPRFTEAEKRHEKLDAKAEEQPGHGVSRVVMSDGRDRPYFMARLRGDVAEPREGAANLCFGLLQFARGATL